MTPETPNKFVWVTAGVLFAILWSSASTATKIGLSAAQPLVIAQMRFIIAGILMLFFSHFIRRYRFPSGREWQYLAVYGFLNVTLYLGCYVVAMQHVTAGVGALAVAANPLIISFLSVFLLKKKLQSSVVIAIILGTAGITVASLPLFAEASVTVGGLLLLLLSMLAYSAGAIYFSAANWNGLNLVTINGWQTMIGGIFLLPFAAVTYHNDANHFTAIFWASVFWLIIPVSVFSVQLWLWLLRNNPVKAGLWLFLCPISGYAIAAWFTRDVISICTISGIALVLAGLFAAQRNSKQGAGS